MAPLKSYKRSTTGSWDIQLTKISDQRFYCGGRNPTSENVVVKWHKLSANTRMYGHADLRLLPDSVSALTNAVRQEKVPKIVVTAEASCTSSPNTQPLTLTARRMEPITIGLLGTGAPSGPTSWLGSGSAHSFSNSVGPSSKAMVRPWNPVFS